MFPQEVTKGRTRILELLILRYDILETRDDTTMTASMTSSSRSYESIDMTLLDCRIPVAVYVGASVVTVKID